MCLNFVPVLLTVDFRSGIILRDGGKLDVSELCASPTNSRF